MRAALAKHYREPVMPVSDYCAKLSELQSLLPDDMAAGINGVFTMIRKSNLLYRTLYCGEEPRKNPCAAHLGKWSGCKEPGHCPCQYGIDVTGWLPDRELTPAEIETMEMRRVEVERLKDAIKQALADRSSPPARGR